jgi:hypothetical protein
MANLLAIAATGLAIRRLLEDACPRDLFPLADFKLFQATDFEKSGYLPEGISIYMYMVGTNTSRRNFPPRQAKDGKRYRPSLPLDLYFLLTPWSNDAELQLRMLGWAMRVLEDTPILPSGLLNANTSERDIFFPEETVELLFNPLSLQDLSVLWENLKLTRLLPSATYVARLVLIDSAIEIVEAGPVQTRIFDMAGGPE